MTGIKTRWGMISGLVGHCMAIGVLCFMLAGCSDRVALPRVVDGEEIGIIKQQNETLRNEVAEVRKELAKVQIENETQVYMLVQWGGVIVLVLLLIIIVATKRRNDK